MNDKERMIEGLVNFIFFVSGVLFVFLAGYYVIISVPFSFIFLLIGVLCLCISVEYTKEESA